MQRRRLALFTFLLAFLLSMAVLAVRPPVYAAKSWDRLQGNRLFPDQFCRDGALISFASLFGSPHRIGMFQSANSARPNVQSTTALRRGPFYGSALMQPWAVVLARSTITDQDANTFDDSAEEVPLLFNTVVPSGTDVIMTLERFYSIENKDLADRVLPPPDARIGGSSIADAGRTTYTVGDCFISKTPDILQQPVRTLASGSQGFDMNVVASGFGPLTFQWYSGAPGDTTRPIAGATGPLLNSNQAGGTSFWVRVSTAAGSTDSAAVLVNRAYLPGVVAPAAVGGGSITAAPMPSTAAPAATVVYGQPDATNGLPLRGSMSTGLMDPSAVAFDANGGMYVVDSANQRVLYFVLGSSQPTRIYGQPDLLSNTPNNNGSGVYGAPGATTLFNPVAVAPDASGVYIVDQYNHRVLYYAGTSTTATRVYGQPGFTTRDIAAPSATTILTPTGVTVDAGGVYISDGGNNRVLYFAGASTTASRVYGQGGSFTTGLPNQGSTPTADRLSSPAGLAHDGAGLYVADTENDRVLYFDGTDTTADVRYGKSSFTSGYDASAGTSATRLKGPWSVTVNSNSVWVSDTSSNRVVRFNKVLPPSVNGGAAGSVYGQANFTSEDPNRGLDAPADNTLNMPMGIAITDNGLYVADMGNHRILFYSGTLDTVADQNIGQPNLVSGRPLRQQVNGAALNRANGVAYGNGGVFVADTENNRVLFFPNGSSTATTVYGQPDLVSNGINRGAGAFTPAANSLYAPIGVAVAADGLYIADTGNNRVLFFDGFSDTTADEVYGQADFTGNFPSDPPNAVSLSRPFAVAVAADGFYVADTGNNRVVFFPNNTTTASLVYGQPDFFSNVPNNNGTSTVTDPVSPPTANNMFLPTGVTVDANGVYVADQYNNRVLYFDGFSDTTADRVYGQPDFVSRVINNDGAGEFRGPRATSLFYPATVITATNGIYVADSGNNRVLFYTGTSTSAAEVYGQPDIGQMAPNNNGSGGYGRPGTTTLNRPWGLALGGGSLWIADLENNRILGLPPAP